MFEKVRKRITYANVAMTLALGFAMTGGAYAAHKYVITSRKQISPKALKELVKAGPMGPAGAVGARGDAGVEGKQGTAGPEGSRGPEGPAGKAGTTGPEGKVGATGPKGSTGPSGTTGASGPQGVTGPEGSPWVVGGLPKGASETGDWAVVQGAAAPEFVSTAISFAVPLKAALDEAHAQFIMPGESPLPTGCKGSYENPEAESGFLCVFAEAMGKVESIGSPFIESTAGTGADRMGARLSFLVPEAGQVFAEGSWAVTG